MISIPWCQRLIQLRNSQWQRFETSSWYVRSIKTQMNENSQNKIMFFQLKSNSLQQWYACHWGYDLPLSNPSSSCSICIFGTTELGISLYQITGFSVVPKIYYHTHEVSYSFIIPNHMHVINIKCYRKLNQLHSGLIWTWTFKRKDCQTSLFLGSRKSSHENLGWNFWLDEVLHSSQHALS